MAKPADAAPETKAAETTPAPAVKPTQAAPSKAGPVAKAATAHKPPEPAPAAPVKPLVDPTPLQAIRAQLAATLLTSHANVLDRPGGLEHLAKLAVAGADKILATVEA